MYVLGGLAVRKIPMTITLGEREAQLLDRLAKEKTLSKGNVVGHALRVLATLEDRLQSGSKVFLEDEMKNKSELMLL